MFFTPEMAERIRGRIAQLESATGAQLLVVVAGKSDDYPEAPWKAFALASSLAGLGAAIWLLLARPWIAPAEAALAAAGVLGAGAAAALLAVFAPPLARRFVTPGRLELEVDQHAHSLFSEHRLTETSARAGILLLVSLFERRVVILPDAGVAARVDGAALAAVAGRLAAGLARASRGDAVLAGIDALESALRAAGLAGSAGAPDEIAPSLIQEKGGGR